MNMLDNLIGAPPTITLTVTTPATTFSSNRALSLADCFSLSRSLSCAIMLSLFSGLFQLVSNLLFYLFRQRATVRDFLVIHQVFVEVREVQLVEFNLL